MQARDVLKQDTTSQTISLTKTVDFQDTGDYHVVDMCVTKLPLTSGCGPKGSSPVCGNIFGSQYRVLRAEPSRGGPRSVDRKCAGRNASGVKGLSSDNHTVLWWPSQYEEAKATLTGPRVRVRTAMVGALRHTLQRRPVGTTGVLDHGMYTRLMSELGRSPRGGAHHRQCSLAGGQGVAAKLVVSARGEVRSRHSSEEVG